MRTVEALERRVNYCERLAREYEAEAREARYQLEELVKGTKAESSEKATLTRDQFLTGSFIKGGANGTAENIKRP